MLTPTHHRLEHHDGTAYRRLEHRDGTVRLTRATVEHRPAGECAVLLAPDAIGVCRSDLKEIDGTRHLRRDFGHEIVGTVVACRPEGLLPAGQRVVLDPHPRVHRTSGFAELVEIRGERAEVAAALVPLPAESPVIRSVFVEPLACVCHCLHRLDEATRAADADPAEPVAVIGAGTAGTLMATVLSARSVPVTLINRGRPRLAFLQDRSVLPRTALRTADEADGMAVPRVIVATAAADTAVLNLAARLVAPAGRVLLYAGTRPGQSFADVDLDTLRREQLTARVTTGGKTFRLVGSHGAAREDFTTAMDLLDPRTPDRQELGRRLDRLVTSVLPLTQGADFLNRLTREPFLGKPVLVPSPPSDTFQGAAQ
ncbi:alcohol dehydrogenase catalytic domain-containing protein [Streptomyces sp. NPDC050610]|uniref:alcohol dehydrogenase catalytic domain-containing protein n=1 Tax=Streptomyces sp. NPDC050610 TaxID=3157097 RepID=UPI00341B3B59